MTAAALFGQHSRSGPRAGSGLRALLRLALTMLLLALAAPAHATEGVELELIDGSEVCGAYYCVADVARLVDGSAELWAQLAAERLGYAPRPGESISLPADTLLGRLAERGYDWRLIRLNGPDVLTIRGAQQSAAGSELCALIEATLAADYGVAARFETDRPLPVLNLPAGDLDVRVRYPAKPGWWLPDAVEFSVDGMLKSTVLLGQYGKFHLPVVIAPDGIAGRTLINHGHLGLEERELAPGREVMVHPADAAGMTTQGTVPAGGMLRLSRLKVPYDVNRGGTVTLVIRTGCVEMQAMAEAQGNAYVGQRLCVERMDDGVSFTGVVAAGPVVVVE